MDVQRLCHGKACHDKEFCWPLTSRSAIRQWCEIKNMLREASIRGGSFHASGFQSDLRQHVRLESNGVEFLMVFCILEFPVVCWQSIKCGTFMWVGRWCVKKWYLKSKIWLRKCGCLLVMCISAVFYCAIRSLDVTNKQIRFFPKGLFWQMYWQIIVSKLSSAENLFFI